MRFGAEYSAAKAPRIVILDGRSLKCYEVGLFV